MKLSAPIFQLKRQARDLKKNRGVTLTQALDEIARREGFDSWSLLQARKHRLLPQNHAQVLDYCNPGDVVLIGGRPRHGKTSFTLGLMVQAMQSRGVRCGYFSLEFIEQEVRQKMAVYGDAHAALCTIDCSDAISTQTIIERTRDWVEEGSVIVVDYLQLLDQKRTTPPLQAQVERLKDFASERRCTVFFISQVSRSVEDRPDRRPGPIDVHLPNPLDLGLFNKLFFLYRPNPDAAWIEVSLSGDPIHRFEVSFKQGRFL